MSSPTDKPDMAGKPPVADSPDDSRAGTRASDASQQYFPEDERSPMEWEGDHSDADFDLEAELDARLGKAARGDRQDAGLPAGADETAGAGGLTLSRPSKYGQDEHHDPDFIRPSLDWEDDHTHDEIDVDAEIEAKLGKEEESAGAEPAKPAPSRTEIAADAPDFSGQEEFDYPEDIRPSRDWEIDTDIDVDAEIEAKLGKAPDEKPDTGLFAGGGAAAGAGGVALSRPSKYGQDEHHDPDFIRPCKDWEDDHTHDEIDVDAEIEAKLGKAEDSSEVSLSPGGSGGPAMHPDLAASLAASRAFAERGYQPAAAGPKAVAMESEASGNAQDPDAVPPDLNDDAPPPDGPEQCTEDNGVPVEGDNSDGALSPSGYLSARDASQGLYAGDSESAEAPQQEEPALPAAQATASAAGTGEEQEEDGKADGEEKAAVPDTAGSGGDDGSDDEEEEENGEPAEDKPMSLRDHLRELRKRLLRAFLWMLAGFLLCYPFSEQLFNYLMMPLIKAMPETSRLIFTNPPEAFFTFLKVAFVAGIFVTSPMVFYQIWAFVAPGLYKEEKLYIVPVAVFSAIFFICGGAFCYFIGFPFVFEFFMSYNKGLIQAMPSLNETLSFVLQLLLAFGLVFELPLFVFFLARLGVITADMMRRFRRYSLLVNVIVAAILTPPDVMSQLLMAGPLIVLYEFSIIIAAIFGKKKPGPEKDEADANNEDDEEDDEEDTAQEESAVPMTASTTKSG